MKAWGTCQIDSHSFLMNVDSVIQLQDGLLLSPPSPPKENKVEVTI